MLLEPGQTAVVTGAASGIGLALAHAFAARGLHVLLADIDGSGARAAASLIPGAIGMRCDVSDAAEVERMRDTSLERFGRVDILCNNAGVILPFRPIWEHSASDWDWLLGVNLTGVVNGIRAFLPLLVEQRRGHMLNTASMAGVSTIPFNGPYNAAKHAVVALTETISAEMEALEIPVGVSVLCTGLVSTNIRHSPGRRPDARAKERRQADSPTKPAEASRAAISAEDVAAMTIAGIEANCLHIFTNPGSGDRVRGRIDRLLADITD